MTTWIPEAAGGGSRAKELYIELATTILADEMTKAEGLRSDDLYHAITLLAAVKPLSKGRDRRVSQGRAGEAESCRGEPMSAGHRLVATAAIAYGCLRL